MADFVSIDQFQAYMKVTATDDDVDTELLQLALDAAHAGARSAIARDLTLADDEATARSFTTHPCLPVLRIDDCTDVTLIGGVAFDRTLWRLEPLNNRATSGQWRPYEQIRSARWWTVDIFGTIEITATWGWTTIPPQAYTAVLALAKDISMNQEVSFGLAQITDYAGIRARENPEVWRQLKDLQRAEALLMG